MNDGLTTRERIAYQTTARYEMEQLKQEVAQLRWTILNVLVPTLNIIAEVLDKEE